MVDGQSMMTGARVQHPVDLELNLGQGHALILFLHTMEQTVLGRRLKQPLVKTLNPAQVRHSLIEK